MACISEFDNVRLYHGDCLSLMSEQLEPGSVDLIVTSPPYLMGKEYEDPKREWSDYIGWITSWFALASRVLDPERGNLFFNYGCPPSESWRPFELARYVKGTLQLQNTIHWIKAWDASGHFSPIRGDCTLHSNHEYIFHFSHSGRVPLDRKAAGVPYTDMRNASRYQGGSDGWRCRGNTWFLPYKTIRSRIGNRPHPATFPKELPARCLKLHGPCRLMLDPFMGIGTSGVAAVEAGVPFVGIDKEGPYVMEAERRIADALREKGNPSLKSSGRRLRGLPQAA